MKNENEKVIIHLELSQQAARLLYALNQHALKKPVDTDPNDETDVLEATRNFAMNGIAERLRATFAGKFTEQDFDELAKEIGTTLWDVLH